MNYRYDTDSDLLLKKVVAWRPAATLHDIRRSHPAFRSMSLDHLALRLARLDRDPQTGPADAAREPRKECK
jgi:hypothetical protein